MQYLCTVEMFTLMFRFFVLVFLNPTSRCPAEPLLGVGCSCVGTLHVVGNSTHMFFEGSVHIIFTFQDARSGIYIGFDNDVAFVFLEKKQELVSSCAIILGVPLVEPELGPADILFVRIAGVLHSFANFAKCSSIWKV